MSAHGTVIVIDTDGRAANGLAYALGDAGVVALTVDGKLGERAVLADLATHQLSAAVLVVADHAHPGPLPAASHQVVLRVKALRDALSSGGLVAARFPILAVGLMLRRGDAAVAGATESMSHPLHARDVALVAKLLTSQIERAGQPWVSSLTELGPMLRIIRALAALGRSGVLTVTRGMRRGEVRFYHGEVTSAQVGFLHGQAALHQLLLWIDGRMEFRVEEVVRRQQIPLRADELFEEAAVFLTQMRDSAPGAIVTGVYERDPAMALAPSVPPAVQELLRLFDGNRRLADVVEDAPYRQFELLRVLSRAIELGVLRLVGTPWNVGWQPASMLERWLIGLAEAAAPLAIPVEASGAVDTPPAGTPGRAGTSDDRGRNQRAESKAKSKKKRAKSRRGAPPATVAVPPAVLQADAIDWGQLIPRESSAEVEAVSQVVPVAEVVGEVDSDGAERKLPDAELSTVLVNGIEVRLPTDVESTNLASDLAQAQAAVLGRADSQAVARKSPDVSNLDYKELHQVRHDAEKLAKHFTTAEEGFFEAGQRKNEVPPPSIERFSDLDEGYRPMTFWERLLGKRKRT